MKKIIDRVIDKFVAIRSRHSIYESVLDQEAVQKISEDSLLFYFGNIHSQRGQDGILGEIFRRLKIKKGYFVEFGAWDGFYLSNCRFLYEKGWKGCFIEGDNKRFKQLENSYKNSPDVQCINEFVGAPGLGVSGRSLSDILLASAINLQEVSFVSIDVDGPDLEIFREMGFRPPVVLIEGGFNFSPLVDKAINTKIAWNNCQQPLAVIFKEAIDLGYTPVCFYQDTYLIRSDLIDWKVKSVEVLYKEAFYFLPLNLRENLMQMREKNAIIKEIEKDFFGFFTKHPLNYNDK